jgi:hypothetical protein
MRRLALILALAACSAWAAPAFVQGVCSTNYPTAPVALAFGSAVTAGDEIVVYGAAHSFASPTLSASDTLNGSYTNAVSGTPGSGFPAAVFYFENSAGGSDTVTFSASDNSTIAFCATEWSGLPTSATFDKGSLGYASGTSGTAPSLSLTQTDLVIGGMVAPSDNMGATTVSAPYTLRVQNPTGGINAIIADQGVVSAGTAAGATWTATFGGDLVMVTLGFKAGSPPPVTMVPRHGASTCCRERRP